MMLGSNGIYAFPQLNINMHLSALSPASTQLNSLSGLLYIFIAVLQPVLIFLMSTSLPYFVLISDPDEYVIDVQY